MREKLLSIFIISYICFALPMQAQNESNIANMTPDDYAHLELPPLDVLFENLKANPLVEIQDVKKEGENSLLKKEKRSWLKYLSLNSGYNYGILGNTSTFSDTATPIYSQYNQNAQSYYFLGGSLSLPIEDLFDLKPKVNRQKLKVKEIDLQKERALDELKIQVVELYTSAISGISIIKLLAEKMVFANAQYQMGERDFMNGKGDPSTLNTQKEMQVKAANDFESARASLNSALLKLELLTRTKIINKNKIK